jgi:hypothetical protein
MPELLWMLMLPETSCVPPEALHWSVPPLQLIWLTPPEPLFKAPLVKLSVPPLSETPPGKLFAALVMESVPAPVVV